MYCKRCGDSVPATEAYCEHCAEIICKNCHDFDSLDGLDLCAECIEMSQADYDAWREYAYDGM